MDIATIIGIFSGMALIFGAIVSKGDLSAFVSLPSVMIVLGGTLAATLITFPLIDVIHAFQAVKHAFSQKKVNPNDVVRVILTVANLSRRQGLVALSKVRTDNAVLKKALMLIADGAPEVLIRETLRIEIEAMRQRHSVAQDVFRKMGAYAPAFGMLGTLIGLVQMLGTLDDPKTIGPAMALALITTFYGSLLSSLFFLPLAGKLKSRTSVEVINLEIIFEGALSILENNNPLLIYEKLSSFIPPKVRDKYQPEKSKKPEQAK
ncbi:motility protein A [Dethiosulfatarculus sandiegensis]|uniref:Flagellar motor protein MotP n=1 Tax=Dethiosulfatarculus sandiegensis TaxID=1429043 RepID=A0A0D2JCV9_9BACT|nr:MotA/TolQ/ExbB proton channel family protein [Dethiosulfatarculus sandiegensis]KIX13591.1 flagellar motor protein MotP [Dethiosulfatarculus sandiegensis]